MYDGHGGPGCANFLKERLHQFVTREPSFPQNPEIALRRGFEMAEKEFLESRANKVILDKSGSCALVVLIVGSVCYVANVGDSRALLSVYLCKHLSDGGRLRVITKDHKPEEMAEKIRITTSGGKIYRSAKEAGNDAKNKAAAPYRVFPGHLSVSRTFGDPQAKLLRYGGKPGVVIAAPEIFTFKILPCHDFIVLGCDGIFDQLSSQTVLSCAWNTTAQENIGEVDKQCGLAVDSIIKNALQQHSLDNVTAIIIAFDNFKRILSAKREGKNKKVKGEYLRSRPKSGTRLAKPLPYGMRRCNGLNRNLHQ